MELSESQVDIAVNADALVFDLFRTECFPIVYAGGKTTPEVGFLLLIKKALHCRAFIMS